MVRTEYSWMTNEELLVVAALAGEDNKLVVELRQRLMVMEDYTYDLEAELGVEHGGDTRIPS